MQIHHPYSYISFTSLQSISLPFSITYIFTHISLSPKGTTEYLPATLIKQTFALWVSLLRKEKWSRLEQNISLRWMNLTTSQVPIFFRPEPYPQYKFLSQPFQDHHLEKSTWSLIHKAIFSFFHWRNSAPSHHSLHISLFIRKKSNTALILGIF